MKQYIILCHVILALLLIVMVGMYQYCCNRKDKISKLLKDYIVHIIVVILLYSLISPIILYFFGVFKEGGALYNSDILGYYGTLIGGGVTVLGIYWTFKHESEKSKEEREYERQKSEEKRRQEYENLKEERRKNSLPILRFNFDPIRSPVFDEITSESTANTNQKFLIKINTSDEASINKNEKNGIRRGKADGKTKFRIIENGYLEIKNIGLGAAILSNVSLFREDTKETVNNLQVDTKEKFIILPGQKTRLAMLICSNNFSKDDYLYVDFKDTYLNKYRYRISFEKDFFNKTCKSKIEEDSVFVLPELVDTVNN